MSKRLAGKRTGQAQLVGTEVPQNGGAETEEFDWHAFDPTMLKGGLTAPLATELVVYRDRLDELLAHKGEYVVIKGPVIAGYFRNRRSAVAAAIDRFGPGPVLIKKIVEREPIRHLGHAIL